ncbi:glycosyltransferase [Natronospirillum operosum]|uniref:Glycosyltransferase n=1 Tax=Natronospirillum operosum TaxID=2759953 RepID=A0A4Z0WJA6_9GAMM|nr:glycosyltransferase [Natronospirillum operosum]TGG95265.1 glycosyltransferase [Natronospirillum operosum]
MEPVNILCMKWGTKYGPDYVNTLYNMVARNITLPFRFVCLTDDTTGLKDEVEALPFPKTGYEAFDNREDWTMRSGAWLKLATFAKPLHDLKGKALFIDLDVVIVGNIDDFFTHPGEFLVIKEWDKKDVTGNTSVYRFDIGAHQDAIDHFRDNPDKARQGVRNEQEYITQYLHRQGKLGYWPEAWCRSFKRHCVHKGLKAWRVPPEIPHDARIIVFHGLPNPEDAVVGRSGKWYRKVLPTPWIAEHWR